MERILQQSQLVSNGVAREGAVEGGFPVNSKQRACFALDSGALVFNPSFQFRVLIAGPGTQGRWSWMEATALRGMTGEEAGWQRGSLS